MFEVIIVVGIVAVVAGMAGRSFYRTITAKNEGCGCTGDCSGCTLKDLPEMDHEQDVEK